MFIFIVGNIEQSIFKIGVAKDPLKSLLSMQSGNPYKLSVISKARVPHKNAASMVEQLAHRELDRYKGAGEWLMSVPTALSEQFVNGHYIGMLLSKADVKPAKETESATAMGRDDLQRLTVVAEKQGLTFEDILGKVEQAYVEGMAIDKVMTE